MKYLKSLGLLILVIAAVMAAGGTASANVTSSEGGTPTVTETSTNTELDGAFVTVKCGHIYVHKKATDHGIFGTGWRVKWWVTTEHKTECNYTVTTEATGTTETTSAGTETSTGAKFSIHTSVGTCVFTTNGTDIGTITDSSVTGGNAVRDVNSAKIPRTGGNFLCGSSGTMTGSFTITSPSEFNID